MGQRARIILSLVIVVGIAGGLMYLVGIFPPPSSYRCFGTDPASIFYVVKNPDGTFSPVLEQ